MMDHYVPMAVTSGLSYTTQSGHDAYVDVTWRDWRPMQAAVAQITNADAPLVDDWWNGRQ